MSLTQAERNAIAHPEFLLRAHQLLVRAMPVPEDLPLVNRLMDKAKAKGLTWITGLDYVLEQRAVVG